MFTYYYKKYIVLFFKRINKKVIVRKKTVCVIWKSARAISASPWVYDWSSGFSYIVRNVLKVGNTNIRDQLKTVPLCVRINLIHMESNRQVKMIWVVKAEGKYRMAKKK